MQKQKRNLLLILSAVFVLVFSGQVQSKAENNENATNTGLERSEEHKSTVANFVQSLLNVASSAKGGIGEQVRVIAQQQND